MVGLKEHEGLFKRYNDSVNRIDQVRNKIQEYPCLENRQLVAFAAGSLGRGEFGKQSDLDIFLLSNSKINRLSELRILSDIIRLNDDLGYPEFSNDARFLKVYEKEELIRNTGNPVDDSENFFTTRMLMLLESKCLYNEEKYKLIVLQICAYYFRDSNDKKKFKHLFLLNDILRYWRTLCLNYESRRNDVNKPWRKKNINIKFGRMLTVFATVLNIIVKDPENESELFEITKMTPLERFLDAIDFISDKNLNEERDKFLNTYEWFLSLKENPSIEKEIYDERNIVDEKAYFFSKYIHECLMHKSISEEYRKFMVI